MNADPAAPRPDPGQVVVDARDLARLLLEFRSLQRTSKHSWSHMHDYDISLERLADVLEAHGKPDPRLRCGHQAPFEWPGDDGGDDDKDAAWCNVRCESDAAPARHRHLAVPGNGGDYFAFCGFYFVNADLVRSPSRPYPDCPVCSREQRLRREHHDQIAGTAEPD